MRIYTSQNGQLYVNAVSKLANGSDVEGHLYFTQAGIHNGSVQFQRGAPELNGVSGVTDECLLQILSHRIKFLDSKAPCTGNKQALAALTLASEALEKREITGACE